MERELFTFADKRVWATPRLENRFRELQQHESDPLSAERLHDIHTEMANIAFEGLQRQREVNTIAAFENQFANQELPGMEVS